MSGGMDTCFDCGMEGSRCDCYRPRYQPETSELPDSTKQKVSKVVNETDGKSNYNLSVREYLDSIKPPCQIKLTREEYYSVSRSYWENNKKVLGDRRHQKAFKQFLKVMGYIKE